MRGANETLLIGERVRYFRNKRGLTQRSLAELVGKTEPWMRAVESGRQKLDRLSVLSQLADVLGVTLGDLIGQPTLLQWKSGTERASVPKVRAALTRGFLPQAVDPETIDLDNLRERLRFAWQDWQACEYTRLTNALPDLLAETSSAARALDGDEQQRAQRQAASVHQLAAVYLPKLGETDLAILAASRGLEYAQLSGSPVSLAALYRIVAYSLGALGEFDQATATIGQAITELEPLLTDENAGGNEISVYGMLFLIGSRAAAQAGSPELAAAYLDQAERVARQLGGDRNYAFTAFGPTNVQMHRVVAAGEQDNYLEAAELGGSLDTSLMPVERRGRHAIETARALSQTGRSQEAVALLLDAETFADEQIRHHPFAKETVRRAVRSRTPVDGATELAGRMKLADL